jgi:hypothetical protein
MASLERYISTGTRDGRCFVTNPWFKFYPTDWKADDRLRMCSAASRGLWVEMLCICHQSKPYGHLLVNGLPPTDTQLAVLSGIPTEQVSSLLAELETAGVFSRTLKGVIYSRRMTRDEKKSKINQENGKNGGASKHKNNKDNPKVGKRNPSDGISPRSQKPDIIYGGKVIRLKQETFDSLLAETGLTDVDFARFLDGEDDYFAKMPKHDQAKWFFFLSAKIKKMKIA